MRQTLHTLPREAQDTLLLLVVIGWILAPQIPNLPLWCSAMALCILLWRGKIAWQGRALPARGWLLGLALLAALATYFSHSTLLGRDAGVTLIVLLLTLKTLELHAQRDAFVVFFLGFFVLLSNFFFSQSLLVAASMLLGLLGLLTALVNSHMPLGKPSLWQAARTAGWMALLGAPIMVVLFVLFPRLDPLWGLPEDATRGRTGLSSQMPVGSIASLALDSSVAMRIRFDGEPPRQRALYFRGPVLSTFDGREWLPLRSALPPAQQLGGTLDVSGTPLRYEVTLEGNNHPWLLLLDGTLEPPELPGYTPRLAADLQWVVERPISALVRYRAQTYPDYRHGPLRAVDGLRDFLRLPGGFNPRTLALAAEMLRDPRYAQADTAARVAAVLERLRNGGYEYSLSPGVFGENSADEFWFDRKQGFCEHIASAFVVLMRAMGVPARIVTGYQGGERNPVDGLWTVRQSDAHAWAEVWIEGQGWTRVDPTAAVAPVRIDSVNRLEAPGNAFAKALVRVNPAFAVNLRALWDATNNRWNQWVLNYSQSRQFDLLRSIGFASPQWEDLLYVLMAVVVVVSLLGAGWTLLERLRQDPWLRLLGRAGHRLQRAGLALPPNAPPRTMAALLQGRAGTDAQSWQGVHDWLLRLEAWRYAQGAGAAGHAGGHRRALAGLRREFRRLAWPDRL